MSTDYAPAIPLFDSRIGYGGWVPTNRHWIVVHGTAGDSTIEAVQQTFITNAARGDPSSTHYGVGIDGRVGQYVPENSVAWGNGPITGPAGIAGDGVHHDAWWDTSAAYPGNANPPTLGIEHCKTTTDNSAALTTAQQAASFALIAHLCERWNIPRKVYGTVPPADATGGVTGHFSMDPVNRSFCPGAYPWQALANYLGGIPMVPTGWHDNGTVLTAPNGIAVVGGFRTHILNAVAWDPANTPIAVESAANPADPANPLGCAGARQYFLRSILVWQSCDGHIWETDAGKAAYLAAQQTGTDPLAVECKQTLETLKATLGKLP